MSIIYFSDVSTGYSKPYNCFKVPSTLSPLWVFVVLPTSLMVLAERKSMACNFTFSTLCFRG